MEFKNEISRQMLLSTEKEIIVDKGSELLVSKWMDKIFYISFDRVNYWSLVIYWTSAGLPVQLPFYPVSKQDLINLAEGTGREYKANWELGKKPRGSISELERAYEDALEQEEANESDTKIVNKSQPSSSQSNKGGTEGIEEAVIDKKFDKDKTTKGWIDDMKKDVKNISAGKFRERQLFNQAFAEFENLFGISIGKKIKYRALSTALSVSPQSFNKIHSYYKRVSGVMTKEGIDMSAINTQMRNLAIGKFPFLRGNQQLYFKGRSLANAISKSNTLFTLRTPAGRFQDLSTITNQQIKFINQSVKEAILNGGDDFVKRNSGKVVLDNQEFFWSRRRHGTFKDKLIKNIGKKLGAEAEILALQSIPIIDLGIDAVLFGKFAVGLFKNSGNKRRK